MDEMSETRLAQLRRRQDEASRRPGADPGGLRRARPGADPGPPRRLGLRARAGPGLRREERRPAQVPVRQLRPCAARIRQGHRATCLPGLGKEELYWRLDFIAGALTYAMADFGLIKRPAGVTRRRAPRACRARTDPFRRRRAARSLRPTARPSVDPSPPTHETPMSDNSTHPQGRRARRRRDGRADRRPPGQCQRRHRAVRPAGQGRRPERHRRPRPSPTSASSRPPRSPARRGPPRSRRPTTTSTWSCCAAAT